MDLLLSRRYAKFDLRSKEIENSKFALQARCFKVKPFALTCDVIKKKVQRVVKWNRLVRIGW